MEREVAEYKLQDGRSVYVEAEVPENYDEEKVGIFRRGDRPEAPSLSQALDKVVPAVGEVFTKITSLTLKPDHVELEVGIKFIGEAGVVIAKASTEANLVVTLKWDRNKTE